MTSAASQWERSSRENSLQTAMCASKARITGGLACQNVDFWGAMTGDIFVKDVLTVKNKAVIEGNINVNKLQVEMGASINGTCHMITPEEYDKLCDSFVTTKLAAKAAPAPKK